MSQVVQFVVSGLARNGGVRVLCEWANRAAASGFDTVVACYWADPNLGWLSPEVRVLELARHKRGLAKVLRSHRKTRAAAEGQEARAVCAALNPAATTVIGGNTYWPSLHDRFGSALVYSQHWEPLMFPNDAGMARRAELGMRLPANRVINSTWLKGKFEEAGLPHHHPLVFPGVDLTVYRPDGQRHQRDDLFSVATLGRSDRWKGLADLEASLQYCSPTHLYTYGNAARPAHRSAYGWRTDLGPLSAAQLASVFRSVDLVVTPSWYESFPLPPLEAMACGTAVLTTRPGTEDYAVDGANSVVVEPRDTVGMARALNDLRGDEGLRKALGLAGVVTASRFTWDAGWNSFSPLLRT